MRSWSGTTWWQVIYHEIVPYSFNYYNLYSYAIYVMMYSYMNYIKMCYVYFKCTMFEYNPLLILMDKLDAILCINTLGLWIVNELEIILDLYCAQETSIMGQYISCIIYISYPIFYYYFLYFICSSLDCIAYMCVDNVDNAVRLNLL